MTQVIEAVSSMERCPFCGSELRRKYNANPRRLITLDGEYSVLERVSRCSNRECPGYERSFRAEELQAIILPRKIFSLDVIMYIGTLRYDLRGDKRGFGEERYQNKHGRANKPDGDL